MTKEKDFIRDRLMPFIIGLSVTIGLSVLYAVLYGFAIALIAAGGFGSTLSGNPLDVIIGVLVGIPLWLLIFASSLAFWALTTWLLGKWTQEKYRDYKHSQTQKGAAREIDERNAWFAEKRRKEAEEKQSGQEAEWEKEWNMMKKQEKENFSSGKQEKSGSANTKSRQIVENAAAKEEKQ